MKALSPSATRKPLAINHLRKIQKNGSTCRRRGMPCAFLFSHLENKR
jgi:hypothetical protein